MKKKSLVLALAVLALVGCDTKKDDTKEVQELKQEIEDLKANVKELEEDKSKDNKESETEDKETASEETEQLEDDIVEKSDTEDTRDELVTGTPSTLPEILMTNIWTMTDDAISAVEFEESINLIKNNPEIFLDDSAADSLINMFNHVYWDELYVDAKTPQPITKIEGEFMREFDVSFDSDKYNVFKIGFFPNPKKDGVPFCTVFYCGNIRNYLFPFNNGQQYMKIWALPVGVYELEDKDGGTYTTYIYVSSETFQHTAYNYFGEWWTH